ncbi:ribonuclease P protein subunit [Candidatus Woesearchaeota archaeon]|jgi:ribonuclease P protein subunit POP4|nr:ribonuclease P protein subunit [Candidatus Woesearchaeota archaeon]
MRFLKTEFIGLDIEVMDSGNKSLIGLKGKIIDETKNTFVLKTGKGTKKVIKKHNIFNIQGKTVKGNEIMKRPEDRIKIK